MLDIKELLNISVQNNCLKNGQRVLDFLYLETKSLGQVELMYKEFRTNCMRDE